MKLDLATIISKAVQGEPLLANDVENAKTKLTNLIKELEGSGGVFISMTIACKEELKILEDYEGGMYSVEEVEKLEKEIIRLQELNRKEIDRTDRLERKIADLETENAKLKAQAVHDSWALNPERMGK